MALRQVDVRALRLDRLEVLIGSERAERFESTAATAREFLDGRTILNVNSTATGGGVAEMLQTLLAYVRGVGVDARWLVIEGNPRFFEITKRLHNHLYGTAGDGGPLGAAERQVYEDTLRGNVEELRRRRPSRRHRRAARPATGRIGCGRAADRRTRRLALSYRCRFAERILRPRLGVLADRMSTRSTDMCSRASDSRPTWVPREDLAVIAPSIDPFSAKNESIDSAEAVRILRYVGILATDGSEPIREFTRRDGSRGRVTGHVDLLGTGPAPPHDAPIVLQASRWDALKDMSGVMVGFAEHVVDRTDAHLILAGPQARGVADDPEANQVLQECLALWKRLPEKARRRAHLVCIPMDDPDENALIVNALQRHAAVVVQKSLAEGFGLTVAEAMWKSRPVVGAAVGGIVDQIVSGETGVLLDDPRDLETFGRTVAALLEDEGSATEWGTTVISERWTSSSATGTSSGGRSCSPASTGNPE